MQEEAAEPEPEAEAEPEAAAATTADAAEAVPDEKAQLKEQIAALEKELVDARGGLLAEQAAAKDAGPCVRSEKGRGRSHRPCVSGVLPTPALLSCRRGGVPPAGGEL